MFKRLAKIVCRRPLWVVGCWLILAVSLRVAAPHWDSIAHDGDFSYLPADVTSAVGESMLREAFPHNRARSQMAIMVARSDAKLEGLDLAPIYDLTRRFHFHNANAAFERAREMAKQAEAFQESDDPRASQLVSRRLDAEITAADYSFTESIEMDRRLAKAYPEYAKVTGRLPQALTRFAEFQDFVGKSDAAESARETVDRMATLEAEGKLDTIRLDPEFDWPLLDLWTPRDEVVGAKLRSQDERAQLIVLQLGNEFMATDNIRVLKQVEAELDAVRSNVKAAEIEGLTVAVSGSAAVGGDMLRSAADSIRHTELFTVILVIAILAIVYRSPLLVLAPLTTIGFSFITATSVVAILTQLHLVPGFSWWDMKVFTTTRIFVVVILFGAGTDFCLFLISRYREELARGVEPREAAEAALEAVGEALVASALTTIVGLGMMFFADFGKFSHSGPVIGLCLLVTLIACLTLTPALLSLLGRFHRKPPPATGDSKPRTAEDREATSPGRFDFFWEWTARKIIAHPGLILLFALVFLTPWATIGWTSADHVTYDFLSELDPQSVSREGTTLMKEYFPIGESGPVTVMVKLPGENLANDQQQTKDNITAITDALYIGDDPNDADDKSPYVQSVRSLIDPLGKYKPGKRTVSILSAEAWRMRLLRAHQRTEEVFVTQEPTLDGSVMRMEVVLKHDPFSKEAAVIVRLLEEKLEEMTADTDSAWHGASFALTGVSAGLRDLRSVTQSDNTRIQVLVVIAVLSVLLVILRRPIVCLYLIVSVLFTYYVTIGLTESFFTWAYAPDFHGLDWKAPIFLFVILVAIGQDYNVYLTTRVFEEQRRLGTEAGLKQAIIRTGGIISSCGLIMAGTFLAMTSGTWVQAVPDSLRVMLGWDAHVTVLRGIVELGFALALGVMLDTFIVRPILAPAFFALLGRWSKAEAAADTA